MNKVKFSQISRFLENDKIAVVGASREPKSFGYQVVNHLKSLNYSVPCINQAYENSSPEEGKYISIDEIDGNNYGLLIVTPKKQTFDVLKKALEKGIKDIWIQQMSETPEVMAYTFPQEVNLITNQCIFMFTKPKGVHKFHYTIKKIFGKLPK